MTNWSQIHFKEMSHEEIKIIIMIIAIYHSGYWGNTYENITLKYFATK